MPHTTADLIIHNAKQLVTAAGFSKHPATGPEMEQLSILQDGAVAITDKKILAVSTTNRILEDYDAKQKIDATGKVVTPGLIDAHTHFVFAGSREAELEMKIKGTKYLEILEKGGGILRTVRDTRAATKDDLLHTCRERARNILMHGTTTIEAKSGYGLELASEIKSLEVINTLNNEGPLSLTPTFLGAHAIPPEFEGNADGYVELICKEWMPKIQQRHLASFSDVFCEKGVFEIEQSRKLLTSGKGFGLLPRIHADELYALGGAELAAEVGATSADHLLYASDEGIERMREAGVIATRCTTNSDDG
jgi:imidazolonepropionase